MADLELAYALGAAVVGSTNLALRRGIGRQIDIARTAWPVLVL